MLGILRSLDDFTRMRGSGVYGGSCDKLAVTEEQIAIHLGDREPRDLGEAECPLSFKIENSPEISGRRDVMNTQTSCPG